MRTRILSAAALLAACTSVHSAPPRPAVRGLDSSGGSPPVASGPIYVDPARACVLRNGRLEEVVVDFAASGAGDSLYQSTPFHRAFPTDITYAATAPWFADEYVVVDGSRYHKYGLPRIIGSTDVIPFVPIGPVMLFREPTSRGFRPEVVYAPVEPGCVFQPYVRVDAR